ncbi:hypothetical protein N780_15545 [Pontibacillus chungwhensis BH030062]|uniref:N-acetyltransferase domain-containing protein n=1 Tax=Pontibacillus chungwhensis BH030062 TaxID=1385513 RepID=A0A0A2UUL6_9BACI|nr:N-acetyltransferase [Pontibacillus chungwhensis]KGP91987.1 hypothetical protein N780_15545 [Pontibacillus chungwhensis BH030062]
MKEIIQQPHDLKELAQFIAKLNQNPSTHIGYAGDEQVEIHDTLMSDFSDLDPSSSFSVCYVDGQIIGAIGVDVDLSDESGEVWGPFIMEGTGYNLAERLWDELLVTLPTSINTFSFLIHKDNDPAQTFLTRKEARKCQSHIVLQATLAQKPEENIISMIFPYTASDFKAFNALHNALFPDTYFSAHTIINRLNQDRELLFAKDTSGEMKGYVYIEANPAHGEGSIEYIGVATQHRRKGLGKQLLTAALHHLFSYKSIQDISICVAKKNEAAISLYKRVGFKAISELEHYEIEK